MKQELAETYASMIKTLRKIKVVPVVKIEDAKQAVPLGKALMAGGLPCAEITFRTSAAAEAIGLLTKEVPELLVGAGTVLSPEQADAAKKAGAKFMVSPGFNPRVVDHCLNMNMPIFAGINNPTGIEMALERELPAVKFFPAEASGGLAMLKAMAAPYGDILFMPTGGVNARNIAAYLAFPRVLACGGSWMVPSDLISAGEFDKITALTKEAVQAVAGA
ncbi:bifunctional 4-hydroxy-2-oxoglutarate aldolase/2-dehydro-3-deoxy-phosphogluconate aldolase [Marispirochaeta sp.]|jgi:2-dehydro-3-deoxyphosphogluconate aldolase / (4S)-4-hydroxy-2-oxoglutarate aldolase|uniref:bifunctional 4-hydroxy-2-oxoglutarate aldolase/2-dehydro-3-deoxy-phosphogluconate aldolase n=1 Tax=Marispirochaeta sp. TaxID=2038653 RepID=UPI0029C6404B|nr:bifunctional 4-hydroxy-2-oxoglutarate aldolase/2-dehydro-3-deoxy-phosphogluconate aldolase [Marispirochaeta sp.]